MVHALRAAIECFFKSRCSPRNCTLETIQELEFDVDDWIGGKLEAALLWVEMLVVTTESLVIQNQKKKNLTKKKAKVFFQLRMQQKKKNFLWTCSQYQSSSCSNNEKTDCSWWDKRWEDLTQKFHFAKLSDRGKVGILEQKPETTEEKKAEQREEVLRTCETRLRERAKIQGVWGESPPGTVCRPRDQGQLWEEPGQNDGKRWLFAKWNMGHRG